MARKTENLGIVAGIVSGTTPPNSKKVLWYDENITIGCPIKYYNFTTESWELLKD